MTNRQIIKRYHAVPTIEGAGVKLFRIFSQPDVKEVDPFLLLDFFDSDNPEDFRKGFPWHPHRGIETITYLLKGEIEHQDSLGNRGVIKPGGCQWMTAGRSIIHQEMPAEKNRILGTQLWLNLPREHKMTEPAYRDITAEDVEVLEKDDYTARIIAGTFEGITGPVKGTYVSPYYFDISIHPGGQFSAYIPAEETVFLFLLEGGLEIPGGKSARVPEDRGLLLSYADDLVIQSESGTRILLIAGKPLREPVAWGGPIVMNTQDELRTAFRQIREGTFIEQSN